MTYLYAWLNETIPPRPVSCAEQLRRAGYPVSDEEFSQWTRNCRLSLSCGYDDMPRWKRWIAKASRFLGVSQ